MTDEVDKVFDPFLGREVEISARLTDRLRGRYASGPTLPNGEPEFGWREFGPTPPIQLEAAAEIDRLRAELAVLAAAPQATDPRDAEIERLREALAPFATAAKMLDRYFSGASDSDSFRGGLAWRTNGVRRTLTLGDFRRARALTTQPSKTETRDDG